MVGAAQKVNLSNLYGTGSLNQHEPDAESRPSATATNREPGRASNVSMRSATADRLWRVQRSSDRTARTWLWPVRSRESAAAALAGEAVVSEDLAHGPALPVGVRLQVG
jgi:hypothetical protein